LWFRRLHVFSLDPATGSETVLHSFQGSTRRDGFKPLAGLIHVGGMLYGTTAYGGTGACGSVGCGTVFSLNPETGTERVLYSFQNNGADGVSPSASLIDVGGTLYGTTGHGGGSCDGGCGTVFSLNLATGIETVLHAFRADGADGQSPSSSAVISINGILYGTTENGGAADIGTIFSLDPATGTETVLYSFQLGQTDGRQPRTGLISASGMLDGTTFDGGGSCSDGCGTVFSFNPTSSTETVLHSFRNNGQSGVHPSGLLSVHGTLYGTTYYGGSGSCVTYSPHGCGAVFSINPATGAQKVLYSFQNNGTDGVRPSAGLIDVGGTLYGTTTSGGANDHGTVFAITHWQ
jgi:uncharacterized repeat protein (TIGR03803 family)